MKVLAALIGFLLLPSGSLTAAPRVWTNKEGKKITAELVRANESTATLRLTSGAEATVKLETLSEPDRSFVAQWRAPTSTPAPASSASGSQAHGFDAPWPREAKIPSSFDVTILKEDPEKKEFVYRSPHFEFTSPVKLKPSLVRECAEIFEATNEYVRLLPLNNQRTNNKHGFHPVTFFETHADYVEAGGVPTSAGICWQNSEGVAYVLVSMEKMGVKKFGKDYVLDRKAGERINHLLSHEITHQLMGADVKQASWYSEGSAEYVGSTPYSNGRFRIANNRDALVASATSFGPDGKGGRNLGKSISMPRLERFMTMSFMEDFQGNIDRNYGLACLLVYYFYHVDGTGDAARVKTYLKELQSGAEVTTANEKLLDGRRWDQLEDDFAKAMRRLGLKVDFTGR